jgi:hypothetical protein
MNRHILLLAAVAGLAMPGPLAAQTAPPPAPAPAATGTNLNINPKRVTFDRLGRAAAVYIMNQGGTAGGFDITLIDRIMLPDGQILPLADAEKRPEYAPVVARLKSAREMLLTTPRRATLAPGGGQTIRIRAGATTDVPPGEYRTHLTVTELPPADTGITAEQAAGQEDGALSFRLTSVLGISIPVIIRVGPVDVRGELRDLKLAYEDLVPEPGKPAVRTAVFSTNIARLGTNSLFGNIEIRGTKERGARDPLGVARGVGVYTEIDTREMRVPLRRIPAKGEQLEISFIDDDSAPGRVLHKATFTVP